MRCLETLGKDPSVKKMSDRIVGRRAGSTRTVETYVEGIKKLMEFMKLDSPSEVLKAFRDGKVNPENTIDQFIDFELESLSHNTVLRHLTGLKKWFRVNDVIIALDKIEMPQSGIIVIQDRSPTKEELRRTLQFCHIRDQVVLKILSSSGLRIGTLLTLKVSDVDFNYPNKEHPNYPDIARIDIFKGVGRKFNSGRGREGVKTFYSTYISPEAKESLKEYIDLRKRQGEEITDDSPLITNIKQGRGEFISDETWRRQWCRILTRADLTEKTQNWNVLHIHTLRKYFRTQCEIAGVKRTFFEFWMGHKSGGYLDVSYFRAQEKEHIEQYSLAITHLNIKEETSVREMKLETEKLQERIGILEEIIKVLPLASQNWISSSPENKRKFLEEMKGKVPNLKIDVPEDALKDKELEIIKIPKHNVDKYIELRKKGYEKDLENGEYYIMIRK